VAALCLAAFLQWVGASAVLPLLPVYLTRRGASDALVGVVIAAFFLGGFCAQYLAGGLADRIGYRPVLVIGLVGYALASAGFLLDVGGGGYAALRAVQGAAAGTGQVASLALVAGTVPRELRGRAFSVVYGAELTGIAVGPLLGALVGLPGMSTLFVIAAAGALLACATVLALTPPPAAPLTDAAVPPDDEDLAWRGTAGRALVGVLVASLFAGLMTGVYEACWSLLMDLRGATTGQIGASWTLYALPFVVVSPLAGWMADHLDRRWLVVGASVSSFVFCAVYPLIPSPTWLIALGVFEAIGVAVAMPAAQSLLADAAPARAAGRAQGLFASVQTAAVGATALLCGALFGVAPWVPFVGSAVIGALMVAALPAIWRPVQGRVRPQPLS
jgi:DHA1 family multidrug resistance protein-like MFS transporter